MNILLGIGIAFAALAALLVGLANHWANTPHGRLKPILALTFRLAPLLNPASAQGAIGATKMDTREAIAKVRSDFHKNTAPLSKPVEFKGTIEDRRLANAPGGELPVRIYKPDVATAEGGIPLLVYFHGGGFVVGSPDYTDAATRILAQATPAVVVSVDYRLAPEHPFPAAVEDCEFAVNWCYENAESLGARTGPVAVAGDSAGGNLSAVMALRDAEAGRGRVGLQVLIYPATDVMRTDRGSQVAFAKGFGLSMKDVNECMGHYVPSGADRANPDLSPLFAKSFAGVAPAYVITAGFDLLRDEGVEYAETLKAAGVPVKQVSDANMPHGFITMTRFCSEAETRLDAIAAEIRAMV